MFVPSVAVTAVLLLLQIATTSGRSACDFEHLEPTATPSKSCTFGSATNLQGSCGKDEFCIANWMGGICCKPTGGKAPKCPNGGNLQYTPMGVSCHTVAQCNVVHGQPTASCQVVDKSGYQNAAGNARFCCVPAKTTAQAPVGEGGGDIGLGLMRRIIRLNKD